MLKVKRQQSDNDLLSYLFSNHSAVSSHPSKEEVLAGLVEKMGSDMPARIQFLGSII
jgi:hypothetical protein